jgi:transcriptional regulator with XRE-family HTH domain
VNIESSHISKIIWERRRELGVSQADLARLSGLSLHGLSDIETGKGNPTLQTLLKLLNVLGLRISIHPANPTAFTDAAGERTKT